MAQPYFTGQTIDDVMRDVLEKIQSYGDRINPTKGDAVELTGVLLEVTDPRARLSRTETRGKLFSCLGELCWYLAGTNDLNFISYYIPEYRKSAEGDKIFGGYGPRLFDWRGLKQLPAVIDLLKRRRDSRQAVIQLFDRYDITEDHKDVPCTCTMQFMIRKDRLHMFTNMRSNDVILGLPHDFFCFTMLQEIMARDLSVELGTYKHAVGSLHLYDRNKGTAQQFLDEGWQSTQAPMPPMPTGDPWPAVAMLREAEFRIRTTGEVGDGIDGILDTVNVYWADIIRLLQVFQCKKNSRDSDRIRSLRGKISSNVYFPFIDKMLNELT